MIIVMKKNATETEIQKVISWIESVGYKAHPSRGIERTIIGAVGGFAVDTMPFAIVQAKRLRLQGVTVGSRRDQIDTVRAIETNGIKPVIDSHFPLEQLADAFKHLKSGQHVGKICIDI